MIGKCNTNLCHWHNTGKPPWWDGSFFVAGCRKCEAKAKADPSVRSAPTPEQAFEKHKAELRTKGQRASVVSRQRKARKAMSAEYRENIRRECA